jgi:hypothetical protein
MINGKYSRTPKPKDAKTLTEAIAGAAVAIVKALKGSPDKTESTPTRVQQLVYPLTRKCSLVGSISSNWRLSKN